MKIIEPEVHILSDIEPERMLHMLEYAGRTCYKSNSEYTPESRRKFVQMVLTKNHESVIEHVGFTVKFVCDRGVMAELTRHRLASFSVESTRYANYSKDKFGNEITVIKPLFFNRCDASKRYAEDIARGEEACECEECVKYRVWEKHMVDSQNWYNVLVSNGAKPEEARSVLPNSLKTEVVMTANLREWKKVFELRTSPSAHPQMRQVMQPLLKYVSDHIPIIFDDVSAKLACMPDKDLANPWASVSW